ncbi:MAG: hypothetical protein ACRDZQ_05270 [Acidimicrobiales bacterium]
MTSSILLFLASLALSVLSSLVLAETLDRLGTRLAWPEGLVGIVTALGADAPEISAAVTALQAGRADLGFGIVLGSNVFNLAALLGLSAVLAGKVRVHRLGLALAGGVALVVTVVVSALLLGGLGPVPAVVLLAVVLVPYAALSSVRPGREGLRGRAGRTPPTGGAGRAGPGLRTGGPGHAPPGLPTDGPGHPRPAPGHPRPDLRKDLRGRASRVLLAAVADISRDLRPAEAAPRATRHDVLTVVPALVSVVLGSVGMVHAAEILGHRWQVAPVLVGTLVLASLTSVPNAIAAGRLALRHRGSAVVSESFNSNTINLLVGIALPTLVVGVAPATGLTRLSVWWLLAMTVATLLLAGYQGGLDRREGVGIIAAYLAFVAVLVVSSA